MHTDLRSFILVSGLVLTMLAGNISIPGTAIEARLVLVAGLALAALALPAPDGQRPIGLIAAPLYAWAGWLALSALWTPSEQVSGYATDLVLLIAISMLTVHAARTVTDKGLDLVWTLFLLAGIVYLLLALASGPGAQGRLSVPGGGPNVFVRVMVIAAIAGVMIAIRRKAVWPLAVTLAMAVGAIMSGSRGGVLGGLLIAALGLVPLFLRLKGGTRVLVVLFGTVGGWVGWRLIRDTAPVVAIVEFVQERFIQETLVAGYSSGRDVITPEAWRLFTEAPATGSGLDAWTALQTTGSDFAHPHNLFLSAGVDGGLMAIGLLVTALIVPVGAVLNRRPVAGGAWASLAAALAVLVSAMFSGYYYDSRLIWFFLIWAVAYVSTRPATESSTEDARQETPTTRNPAFPR